jgi:hypothetical protein
VEVHTSCGGLPGGFGVARAGKGSPCLSHPLPCAPALVRLGAALILSENLKKAERKYIYAVASMALLVDPR